MEQHVDEVGGMDAVAGAAGAGEVAGVVGGTEDRLPSGTR